MSGLATRSLTQRELMGKLRRLADRKGASAQELIWATVEAEILRDERERDSEDALCDLLLRDFSRIKLDRTPGKPPSLFRRLLGRGHRLRVILCSTFRRGT